MLGKKRAYKFLSAVMLSFTLVTAWRHLVIINARDAATSGFLSRSDTTTNHSGLSHEVTQRIQVKAGKRKTYPGLTQVLYEDLGHCQKPKYMPGFKSLCYARCTRNTMCKSIDQVKQQRGRLRCLPIHHLIGVRKAGTTDLIKWFQYHVPNVTVSIQGHPIPAGAGCPLDYFESHQVTVTDPWARIWMNYAPGDALYASVTHRNSTHMTVITAIQYLAFYGTDRSRYVLTLRNPTDRVISYIFHSYQQGWIHKDISPQLFNGTLIHNLLVPLVAELKRCLTTSGELACFYSDSAQDGNLESMLAHSMYVVYLTEVFNFIPRNQIYISKMEEYSANQLFYASEMLRFFGETLIIDDEVRATANKTLNVGQKKPVLKETIAMLDNLYAPFNERLAKLLGDTKWLFQRQAGETISDDLL